MEFFEWEIIIEKVNDRYRPVPTYRADVFRVSIIEGVKVSYRIGSPDVGFHDCCELEKVLAAAMRIVKREQTDAESL